MLFTHYVHQREDNSANFALCVSGDKYFLCFLNFDVHVDMTDVTVVLLLVIQSPLREAAQAGTEHLNISLKQYIPPCRLT